MVNLTMTETRPPITDSALAAVEKSLGISFPFSYRNFLLQNNGGRPSPNIFPIAGSQTDSHGILEWFLSVGEYHTHEIELTMGLCDGRIPSNLIAIGSDPGGNLICISVFGENVGKIYFWEHEGGPNEGEEPDYSNVYLIANNFDKFLASLQDESILMNR